MTVNVFVEEGHFVKLFIVTLLPNYNYVAVWLVPAV